MPLIQLEKAWGKWKCKKISLKWSAIFRGLGKISTWALKPKNNSCLVNIIMLKLYTNSINGSTGTNKFKTVDFFLEVELNERNVKIITAY